MSILRQHPKSILSVKIFPILILFIIPISRRLPSPDRTIFCFSLIPTFLKWIEKIKKVPSIISEIDTPVTAKDKS